MTKGEPIWLILRFAIPLFIGTLFQQAYYFVDTMIVGQGLGSQAVAAMGVTASLYAVLIYFANGLNSGYGIVISRMFGAGDGEGIQKAAAAMILLDAAAALALTVLILPALKPLLHLLHTPEDIFSQAYTYIFVVFAGMAATIAYNMGAGFMRAVGNSTTPLYFLILSCGLNAGLDALFIFGMGMGVAGAALATVLAEAVSAVLCLIYICRNYTEYLPQKEDWRLKRDLIGEMLGTGLSMALMQSLFSLGSIILQKGINHLGTWIITAHTASGRISEMLMMPLSMIAAANAAFVGQNFGAGQYGRIRKTMRQIIGLELLWSLASVLIAYTAGAFCIRLLLGEPDAFILKNAVLNLKVCTLFFFPLGILLALRNALQPMGVKAPPVISSAMELLIKILFCVLWIPRLGYWGVVITEPVIWIICAAFLGVVYVRLWRA